MLDFCTLRQLLQAIAMVETHTVTESACYTVGDDGSAFGPLQIHKSYLLDSNTRYDLSDMYYWHQSVATFLCYMLRYRYNDVVSAELDIDAAIRMARVHNAGPLALHKNRIHLTDRYVTKVLDNIALVSSRKEKQDD